MKDFLRHITTGSLNEIPESVLGAFKSEFPEAINAEWYKAADGFEAVFHDEGIEKIAIFGDQGTILILEENLSVDTIPLAIADLVRDMGKIMNYIRVNNKGVVTFELILRDRNWHRHLLEVSPEGVILNKRRL